MIGPRWVCWHDNQTIQSAEAIVERWIEKYTNDLWEFRVVPSTIHPGMYAVMACKYD